MEQQFSLKEMCGFSRWDFAFLTSREPMQSFWPPCQEPGTCQILSSDFMHWSKSPNQRECLRTIHSNESTEPIRLLGPEHTRTASEDSNMSSWPSHIYWRVTSSYAHVHSSPKGSSVMVSWYIQTCTRLECSTGQVLHGLGSGRGRCTQGGPSWTEPGALLSGRLGQAFPEFKGISYFALAVRSLLPHPWPIPCSVGYVVRCSHTLNKPSR